MNKRQFIIAAVLFLFVFGFPVYKACNFLTEFSNGFADNNNGDFRIIKTVDSLDGKYSATYWEGMGGGAAGWCGKPVNVYKKEESFDLGKAQENRKNQIIAVDCGCQIEMNWASANHLHVVYSNQTYVSIKEKTEDVAVKVSFESK